MKVSRAQDLPEFRVWLWKQWQPGNLFWEVAQITRKQRRLPGQDWAHLEAIFDDRALEEASLYWVTAEMSELIALASKTLPPTTLTPELVPAKSGFVWFETVLHGTAAQEDFDYGEGVEMMDHDIHVRCIVWGESLIPPGPHPALGISTYAELTMLAPAGRTDWEWGEDTDEPIDVSIKDDKQRVASMAEDRRWMATFWLLLSQTGIAETRDVRPQPRDVRKIKRAMPGASSTVRVVNVHKPNRPTHEPETSRQVDWKNRWIVNPFWRQQAYGPRHSLRRPMLIGPYIKGPADKPLKIKDTVHVLKDGEL